MIPEYIYSIWSLGMCPALVRGGRFFDGERMRCVYDLSDAESLAGRVGAICALRRARDRDVAFIELLRQVVKAVSECEDWLIPVRFLDFSADKIRCSQSGEVLFILASEGSETCPDLFSGIAGILEEISVSQPELRAGSILKRIRAEGISASGSPVRIERTLAALASGP